MRRPLCVVGVGLSLWIFLSLWLLPQLLPEKFSSALFPRGELQEEVMLQVYGEVAAKEYQEGYGGGLWQVTLEGVLVVSRPGERETLSFLEEGKLLCTLAEGEEEPLMGQKLYLEGVLKPWDRAANPGQFDAGSWYRFNGIMGQMEKARVLSREGEGSGFGEALWRVQQWAAATLTEQLGEEDGPLLSAMLLGEKGGLKKEVKSLYQKNGISHLLSISGLHLMLLGMGLFGVIGRLPLPKGGAAVISMLCMAVYCIFTGCSVATLRATIMFCVLLLAKILGRSYDSLSALGLAAVIQLILNPGSLWNSGFQLSFLAVVGVSAVVPRLNTLFSIASKLMKSMMVSVGVSLVTLPVLLYHFGSYTWHSIFLNLLVVPMMSLLLWLGLLLLLAEAVFCVGGLFCHLPVLSLVEGLFCQILIWGIKGILFYHELCCRLFEKLPVWQGYQGRPGWLWLILFYLALLLLLWAPHKRGPLICFIGLFAIVQLLTINPRWGMEITMLDVGQGDGMVIRTASGHIYLSDFGSSSVRSVGTYRLIPFLKIKGYGRIKGIFISHLDQDHYNGVLELLEAAGEEHIVIERLFLPESVYGEEENEQKLCTLLELADMTDVSVVFLEAGDCVIDGKTSFYCLHPGNRGQEQEYEANNGSMVLSVEYGDFSLLLTGDVEKAGEEEILKRIDHIGQYDLLKVAHHGSSGSSGAAFLEVIKPKVSLISCGENNSYGHPAKEVVERLEENGSLVLQTPETGAITVKPKEDGSFTVETMY